MLKQHLSQKLLQKLSPQQIQFIKLLQINTLNFEERMEEELLENPALENGKDDEEELDFSFSESEDIDYESTKDEFDISDYLGDDDGGVQLSGDYQGDSEEKEFMPVVYHISFRERLLEQVTGALKTSEEEILADQIIGTLDDDG